MFGFSFFLSLFLLILALVLCLVPVEQKMFSDPCGSIFFPEKVLHTTNADGLSDFKVTPPCSEAHQDRLIWAILTAGIGVLLLIYSWGKKKA